MIQHLISDNSISLLNKALDLQAEKEQVIASNIANAETPGYAPRIFEFEKELKQAMGRGNNLQLATTQTGHIPLSSTSVENVSGTVTKSGDTTGIGDLNGVNLDEEMVALSENELRYETASKLIKKKLTIQKYVISGGQ